MFDYQNSQIPAARRTTEGMSETLKDKTLHFDPKKMPGEKEEQRGYKSTAEKVDEEGKKTGAKKGSHQALVDSFSKGQEDKFAGALAKSALNNDQNNSMSGSDSGFSQDSSYGDKGSKVQGGKKGDHSKLQNKDDQKAGNTKAAGSDKPHSHPKPIEGQSVQRPPVPAAKPGPGVAAQPSSEATPPISLKPQPVAAQSVKGDVALPNALPEAPDVVSDAGSPAVAPAVSADKLQIPKDGSSKVSVAVQHKRDSAAEKQTASIRAKEQKVDLPTSALPPPTTLAAGLIDVPIIAQAAPVPLHRDLAQVVKQMVEHIQTVTTSERTEVTLTLKHPPSFEGAQVTIVEQASEKGKFNVTFSNLTPAAQAMVDNAQNQAALKHEMETKGYALQMIVTTTQERVNLVADARNPYDREGRQQQQEQHQGREQQRQQREQEER